MKKILILLLNFMFCNTTYGEEKISNAIKPVSYFINHIKQIRELEKNLIKYKKSSIVGTSGIGKTQLIRMYVQEKKDKYNIIWFFDCNLDLNEEFSKLAKEINFSLKNNIISENTESAIRDVMFYLTNKENWVLIFDNIQTDQNEKVFKFIDWEHNGNLIFSSQDTKGLPYMVKMPAFSKNDSFTLANMILENKEKNLASFLTEEFKGYPVLIVQGAQFLNNIKGLSKDSYKKMIQASADKFKINIELALGALSKSARDLVFKIALLNNQSFSKSFLRMIIKDSKTLDDDLYELSKFILITNKDLDENDPVFEMHDTIAFKIQEINNIYNNKKDLENITNSIMRMMPESVHKGHIFRTSRTVHENFEVIFTNMMKYNLDLKKQLELKLLLLTDYVNTLNFYKAKKLIDWFEEIKHQISYNLLRSDNYEKYIYARYLGAVGGYYRIGTGEQEKAIDYFIEAKEVLKEVIGYYNIKCNTIYQLANSQIIKGRLDDASKNIDIIDKMYREGFVDESEEGLIHLVKANLFMNQGDFKQALNEVNLDISQSIEHGLKEDDLLFSSTYALRAELLNYLQNYNESLKQLEKLSKMFKNVESLKHEIFGRIYAQIAKAELGKKQNGKALNTSLKAVEIFKMKKRNKNIKLSEDVEFAKALIIYADALAALNKFEESINNYELAEGILKNNYKENIFKIPTIIELFTKGAKVATKGKNKFWQNYFSNQLKFCLEK